MNKLKGSSVNPWLLSSNAMYSKLLTDNFDIFTATSGFLPERWNMSSLVSNFAVQSGKKLRGNHLCDSIYFEKQISSIPQVLSVFPEIQYWDCALEFITDSGFFRKDLKQDDIDRCFLLAKESNPRAKFFYCDYYRDDRKWVRTYKMIESMKSRQIPIDGLAVQLHSNLRPPIMGKDCLTLNWRQCQFWMQKIKLDFDLLIHAPEVVVWQPSKQLSLEEVSELNKKSNLKKELIRYGAGLFLDVWDIPNMQRDAYITLAKMCLETCEMIGFWSPFDLIPWNWVGNRSKPGLWDEYFNPKPSLGVLNYF